MAKNAVTTETTFTQSAKALDTILEQFKSGNLKLEESLELFEDGVKHLKNCQQTLTTTKGKVELLVKDLEAASVSTTDFDAE